MPSSLRGIAHLDLSARLIVRHRESSIVRAPLFGDTCLNMHKAGHVKRILVFPLILLGCSHGANKGINSTSGALVGLKAIDIKEPVELVLKAEPPRKELVQYRSVTHSETRESGQVTHQQESKTDFTIENLFTTIPLKKAIRQAMTTVRKDGQLPLSTLALPEKDEVIEMHLAPNGDVLRAGTYPPQSLYFVPQVSLPSTAVTIGDTWSLSSAWYDMGEGTPFILEMVSILKGFVACGDDQCADIEMSGDVRVAGPAIPTVRFTSHWMGRALFARNTGTLVYMRIDALDDLKTENASRLIESCLETVLTDPANLNPESKAPTCAREGVPSAVRMQP